MGQRGTDAAIPPDAVTAASWPGPSAPLQWRTVALALACAAAVGAGAAWAPVGAALAVGVLLLVALISRAPALVFGVALLALAYSPESLESSFGVLNRPELQKGLLYFALVPLALSRGIDSRLLLPVTAYLVLALLSVLHGDLAPGLTEQQMVSTFVTLTIGWTVLAVRWDWERDARYLKVLAFVAPACVGLGVLLHLAGLHQLWAEPTAFDASRRLRGASIAAELAFTAFIGCAISYICHREMAWRAAPYLVAANALILALTLSRGAAIALCIAAAWPALRFGLQPFQSSPKTAVARLTALVALAGVLLVTLVPALEKRNTGGRYYPGLGTFADPTSGRTGAWKEFYAIAQESPLFGHGLGAGPITRIQQQGFLAQHNEYLRIFLEGGYVGGGLVLIAIVLAIGTCIARAPRSIRLDLVGIAVAVAVLSFFDNTLTSVNLTIPLCLMLGLVAAPRRGRR
jgi:teichuronic acid biosynthesis protein TuaE